MSETKSKKSTGSDRPEQSANTGKAPEVTPLEAAEAKIRLLQLENDELRARVEAVQSSNFTTSPPLYNMDASPSVEPKEIKPVEQFMGMPVTKAPVYVEEAMPNFDHMQQREMAIFARANKIDISKCQRASEIVETLKKGWRDVIRRRQEEFLREEQPPPVVSKAPSTNDQHNDVISLLTKINDRLDKLEAKNQPSIDAIQTSFNR